MSISIPLPLDDGYLRRECPNCERQFKWHHGPTEARPDDFQDPAVYWCPYCGDTAPPDAWWTAEQISFAQQSLAEPTLRELTDAFNRDTGRQRNSLIQFSMSYEAADAPDALQEPADMTLVEPPCHPWEPIKIDDEWRDPLHCIVCGSEFALS